jgi:hypothetical protein
MDGRRKTLLCAVNIKYMTTTMMMMMMMIEHNNGNGHE